ncbi:MAG TPA: Wzz/FepE/Etk N-terminal domain-containing protein, partial [Gemmatimonadaceae bacterium]
MTDGIDALSLLTPLVEKRRMIIVGSIILALAAGGISALMPRKYKAELSLTPVMNNKSTTALGGFAALAGASLNTGYQLTPQRMVELL